MNHRPKTVANKPQYLQDYVNEVQQTNLNICKIMHHHAFLCKRRGRLHTTSMKENVLPPVTVNFQQGLGQKFKQPAGTSIDFSTFEESELLKVGDMDVYPVAIKADASSSDHDESKSNETPSSGSSNS
ncbi:hypothetical protein JHK82_047977 [Glycine max]|nr:hypothetical protein JHK82_047977 [Glycine max]